MSIRTDETARGDLAELMVPQAAALSVAVREETREEIAALLGSLDRTRLEALAVVLAAMVDPDRSLQDALAWVDFDEHGAPAPPPYVRKSRDWSIRESAPRQVLGSCTKGVDMVAVDQALAGHRTPLNRSERTVAVDRGIRRGMGYDQVADALGMDREVVQRAWERLKVQARAEGRYVPAEPVGQIVPGKSAPRKAAA